MAKNWAVRGREFDADLGPVPVAIVPGNRLVEVVIRQPDVGHPRDDLADQGLGSVSTLRFGGHHPSFPLVTSSWPEGAHRCRSFAVWPAGPRSRPQALCQPRNQRRNGTSACPSRPAFICDTHPSKMNAGVRRGRRPIHTAGMSAGSPASGWRALSTPGSVRYSAFGSSRRSTALLTERGELASESRNLSISPTERAGAHSPPLPVPSAPCARPSPAPPQWRRRGRRRRGRRG